MNTKAMGLAEDMRLLFEKYYQLEYGEDVVAVISSAEPGDYQNNPTIDEYTQKGYKLIDANMFGTVGTESERGEILVFKPSHDK